MFSRFTLLPWQGKRINYSFIATITRIEVKKSWKTLWKPVTVYYLEWDISDVSGEFKSVWETELKFPSKTRVWDKAKILESYTVGDGVDLIVGYAHPLDQRLGVDAFSMKINNAQLSSSILSVF